MVEKIEETLNGGYLALYGEIVDKDIYHMKDVADIVSVNDPTFVHEAGHKRAFDFVPDIIFDLGANIGIFSRYARELFPDALIVSVEPDVNNCEVFKKFTKADARIILIQKAIGSGTLFHVKGSKNGAGENYISAGAAYPENEMLKKAQEEIECEVSNVETITLQQLISQYVKEGQKFIIKLDIEGAEHSIFSSKPELDALNKADYIAGELHGFSLDAVTNIVAKDNIHSAIDYLLFTHNIKTKNLNFYALKR